MMSFRLSHRFIINQYIPKIYAVNACIITFFKMPACSMNICALNTRAFFSIYQHLCNACVKTMCWVTQGDRQPMLL